MTRLGPSATWCARLLRPWLVALLCLVAACRAFAANAALEQLQADVSDDGVYLSADVTFTLPDAVRDALQRGVPLHFVATAEVRRARWYWSDAVESRAVRTLRLAYQPLLRRYRLTVGGLSQSFNTLADALEVIQHFPHWHVAGGDAVSGSGKRTLVFSFKLDDAQLPRPFQIGAYGQGDWDISVARSVPLRTLEGE